MEFNELVTLIQENCPEIVRTPWKPVKEEVPSRNWHATKFGGSNPFRGTNFSWPRCEDEKCGKQKDFLCQINLSQLPDQVKTHIGKDSGLFQCFWCSERHDDKLASAHFIPRSEMIPSLQTLAAIAVFESKANKDNLPEAMKTLVKKTNKMGVVEKSTSEEKQVKTWEESEVKEIPNYGEMTRNDYVSQKILAMPGMDERTYEEIFEDIYDEGTKIIEFGIKLAGWLYMEGSPLDDGNFAVWYPTCTDCKVKMDVTFLQLFSDGDILKHDWDSHDGLAWVTLCPVCGNPAMFKDNFC